MREGVYPIKPNLRELRELTGVRDTGIEALVALAAIRRGRMVIIAPSLGPDGALLITRDHSLRAEGLSLKTISVVGAGDSFLGALVWCLVRDGDLELAMKYSVAAGSAAVLNSGTELCKKEDVQRLAPKVRVHCVL